MSAPQAERPSSALDLIALKQRVGQADTDKIALSVLLHLDSVTRGHGSVVCANYLTKHLIMALDIGQTSRNRAFYETAGAGFEALARACKRKSALLSFTTGEYKAVRSAIAAYLRIFSDARLGVLVHASLASEKMLATMGAP